MSIQHPEHQVRKSSLYTLSPSRTFDTYPKSPGVTFFRGELRAGGGVVSSTKRSSGSGDGAWAGLAGGEGGANNTGSITAAGVAGEIGRAHV